MSKEYLEAFETVYNNIDYLTSDIVIEDDEVNGCLMTIKEQLLTIKQALHRLEAIDNSNPSEALKDLECLKSHISARDMLGETNKKIALDICNDVENALLKAQEQEKENAEYKHLEEQLGCDFEFIFKVLKAPKIYIEGMNVRSEYDDKFKFNSKSNNYILNPYAIDGKNPEFLFVDRWGYGYDLRLSDYKKTWWLKEDKSE